MELRSRLLLDASTNSPAISFCFLLPRLPPSSCELEGSKVRNGAGLGGREKLELMPSWYRLSAPFLSPLSLVKADGCHCGTELTGDVTVWWASKTVSAAARTLSSTESTPASFLLENNLREYAVGTDQGQRVPDSVCTVDWNLGAPA